MVLARRAPVVASVPAEALRLRRWPPADLLRTPDRMRLATLMTGRVLSLADLQRHSGQPQSACEAFIADLLRAGALDAVGAAQPMQSARPAAASAQPRVQAGLLSRIRNRLGRLGASRA